MSSLRPRAASWDPQREVPHCVSHPRSPPLDVCFLIRPQPSSKTPKIPKIYTKTGDKGRVGTGEKCKQRCGRLRFKVLPNPLQPWKSMGQTSVHITKMWCGMKEAQSPFSDNSNLQNNPNTQHHLDKRVCVCVCVCVQVCIKQPARLLLGLLGERLSCGRGEGQKGFPCLRYIPVFHYFFLMSVYRFGDRRSTRTYCLIGKRICQYNTFSKVKTTQITSVQCFVYTQQIFQYRRFVQGHQLGWWDAVDLNACIYIN